MQFHELPINGAKILEITRHEDARGYFARLHCDREFMDAGLPTRFVQTSLSLTRKSGVLRGLHFQQGPSREGKLVRCLSGRIFDVVLDLRPDSSTFLKHSAVELSDGRGLFLPPGCAHGFLTLQSESLVLYQMSDAHRDDLACGVRWNDPKFAIEWPIKNPSMNARDSTYPDFDVRLVARFAGY